MMRSLSAGLVAGLVFCALVADAHAETLTISIAGQGTTSPEAGEHFFSSGETVYLSAFAETGWRFDHWEGDLSSTNYSFVPVVMDTDKNIVAVFTEIVFRTLTLTVIGNGSTDPATGAHAYQDGQTIVLNAVPNAGYAFDHWEGALSGSDPYNQYVLMNSDKAITAVFSPQDFTLEVSISGYGVTSPAPGITGFLNGQAAVIHAITLSMDWQFDHWEGALSGSDNPASLTMDGNKNVTAVFTTNAVSYSLTTSVFGSGNVEPEGANTYVPGADVELTATPDPGWEFVGWQGDLSGSENPVTIHMYSNKAIHAVFQEIPSSYSLVTTPVGNGAISPSGVNSYTPGAEVEIAATPDPGWVFSEWMGDLTGSENPVTIVMNANKTITGVFVELTPHVLTMAVSGDGAVSPAVGEHTYPGNEEVELSAAPNPGWHFVQWEGDYSGTGNPVTVTMDTDKTITAVFAPDQHTLTTNVSGNGAVEPSGETSHAYGDEVLITASPAEGWRFWEWQGDLTGGGNPATLHMDGDKTVTAVFVELSTYTLTTGVSGSGAISPEAGAHDYVQGAEVEIAATPGTGWLFDHWTGAATGNTNPISLVMDTNKSITAVFTPIDYSLTTSVTGTGTVDPAGTTTHAYGLEVTLTATPGEGWEFLEWQGDLTGSVNPAQLLIDGDKTVTAVFQQMTTEGEGEGSEGNPEGITEGEGSEGNPEGDGEGIPQHHSADQDGNNQISLTELLRVIQFFNTGGFHCVTPPATSEDGYLPGAGADHSCAAHSSDYNPLNWQISLTELLRLIQFFNTGAYHACPGQGTEDNYCPGVL